VPRPEPQGGAVLVGPLQPAAVVVETNQNLTLTPSWKDRP